MDKVMPLPETVGPQPSSPAEPSPLPDLLNRVRVLIAGQRFKEAEDILADGVSLYPHDVETSASFAVVAAGQENWAEAAERWRATLLRFPSLRFFHGAAATAYARAGFVAEADALLELCFAEDGGSIELRNQYALIAQQTERWDEAAERWGKLMQLDPQNPIYGQLRADALWQADLARSSSEKRQPPGALDSTLSGDEVQTLLTKFESLGDNCEFGLLQRHFGVEPATLYRFSAVTPACMVEVLDLGLAPLGAPEHTIVEISGGEYMVRDSRGYFTMHTFVNVNHADEPTILKRQQARITILRRKMLFQLGSGDRIFIFKESAEQISDDMLRKLSAGLRRYGPNRLLGVRHAEQEHPSGTITRLEPDIWVGYVSTMFGCREEQTDREGWIEILRKVDSASQAANWEGPL